MLRLETLLHDVKMVSADFKPHTERAERYNIFDSFAVYLMYLDYRNTCRNCITIQNELVEQMQTPLGIVD